MARSRTRSWQLVDVVTGLVSGTLAATFFTLATVAAVSGADDEAVVLDALHGAARP